MNIIDAYIKFNKQLVIIISGMSGTGKTKLAQNISDLFKLELINMNKYCNSDYAETVKILQGVEVVNWDSDDIYDWKAFNDDVNKILTESDKAGIVICGVSFPTDKLLFTVDFHIQIKLSKQNLYTQRKKYLDEKTDCQEAKRKISDELDYTIFNQLTYTYYLDLSNRSTINKYINANDYITLDNNAYDEKLYDDVYEYLINQINKNVYKEK